MESNVIEFCDDGWSGKNFERPAVQQATLESYADRRSFEIVGVTSEHASGLDNPRRGLYETFRAVDSGQVDFLPVENPLEPGSDGGKLLSALAGRSA